MLNKAYDVVLKLPNFRGKTRIASFFRNRLKPKASRIIHGMAMELDAQEWLQIDLRSDGQLEPRTTALFQRVLKKGDTYIDVGAHVGYHALIARHFIDENGRVFAIDPQPYNCDKLLTNAMLNGFANITVVAAAVGAAEGFVSLRHQSRNDKTRLTLVGSGLNDQGFNFVAPVISLAWLFKTYDLRRVDLLKIDVEGFELEVLQGAGDSLVSVGNIIVEILPDENWHKVRKIEQLLRAFGFCMSDVQGKEWKPGCACAENNVWAWRP
jgi:FkbM family methyltransferase